MRIVHRYHVCAFVGSVCLGVLSCVALVCVVLLCSIVSLCRCSVGPGGPRCTVCYVVCYAATTKTGGHGYIGHRGRAQALGASQ